MQREAGRLSLGEGLTLARGLYVSVCVCVCSCRRMYSSRRPLKLLVLRKELCQNLKVSVVAVMLQLISPLDITYTPLSPSPSPARSQGQGSRGQVYQAACRVPEAAYRPHLLPAYQHGERKEAADCLTGCRGHRDREAGEGGWREGEMVWLAGWLAGWLGAQQRKAVCS